MTTEALADRIVTYCDALAAFSLVNALAFVITLAEPEIRCSVAVISLVVSFANIGVCIAITFGLVWLRRFELSLRKADEQEPRVAKFWNIVQTVRITLVWGVTLFVVLGLWAATLDPTCVALKG